MSYYPILVDLKGKKAVVVGGGIVAQRKIEALLECGADVYVISPALTPELQKHLEEEKITLQGREFSRDYIQGAFLVIAATDDPELNHRVSEFAREKGVLVNAVDQPSDCDFIVPSVIRRGDLLIAASTSGKSPAMAKRIREKLSSQFGNEYADFLVLMGRIRKDVLSRGLSQDENSRIFHELVDSNIIESIRRKDWKEVASDLERILGMRISPENVIDYIKAE
ncbi:bifunctional precorrin-2 dehydrogenase/sirohydrochlorin ferrochelatase [Deltaproteobacteria bacterium]|nr:bifunctional precorrin-2 dehydrogenase/sirohydrochlorin ferrochelatase [Deltaproteobacteria bacterium]